MLSRTLSHNILLTILYIFTISIHSLRPTLSDFTFYSKLKLGKDPIKSFDILKHKKLSVNIEHLLIIIDHITYTFCHYLFYAPFFSVYHFTFHVVLGISDVRHTAILIHILQYRYVSYNSHKSVTKL